LSATAYLKRRTERLREISSASSLRKKTQHAMRFLNTFTTAGGQAQLEPLPRRRRIFKSPLAVFEHGLHQEQTLADEISNLLNLSLPNGTRRRRFPAVVHQRSRLKKKRSSRVISRS